VRRLWLRWGGSFEWRRVIRFFLMRSQGRLNVKWGRYEAGAPGSGALGSGSRLPVLPALLDSAPPGAAAGRSPKYYSTTRHIFLKPEAGPLSAFTAGEMAVSIYVCGPLYV
jgi:hypothetical protein